ncbi:hypothetical protein Q5752_001840 [Cryptotrichosporon argae]
MANASSKRIASANEAALRQLRLGLVGVNLAALLIRYVLAALTSRRALPGFWTAALHLLATTSTVGIWRWFAAIGTPRRDGAGVRVGEDLGGKGVVEMAWDAVYMTWLCTLGSALLGNWVWLLYVLAVPGVAAYKLFSTLRPLLAMVLPGVFGARSAQTAGTGPGQAGEGQPGQQEAGESRKQAKLRARMEKGDKRVQAVQRK